MPSLSRIVSLFLFATSLSTFTALGAPLNSRIVTDAEIERFSLLNLSYRYTCYADDEQNTLGILSRAEVTTGARWRAISPALRRRAAKLAELENASLDNSTPLDAVAQRLLRTSEVEKKRLRSLNQALAMCEEATAENHHHCGATETPAATPTPRASATPTRRPSATPASRPTLAPTSVPGAIPTVAPTRTARPSPTRTPTSTIASPSNTPQAASTATATVMPTHNHTGGGQGPELSSLPRGTQGISELALRSGDMPRSYNTRDTFRTRVAWTHYSYDDPIVWPRQPGKAHLHLFFGNALVDAFTSLPEDPGSVRTRCRSAAAGGTANCSGYWMPALFDNTGNVLPPDFSLWYYKAGYQVNTNKAVVPPTGLKIIVGKASATAANPQNNPHLSWNCTDDYRNDTPYIPTNCTPGSILGLHMNYPACWNGRDLDSPDHISHMAYGNGQSGCPASHPVQIPEITLNIEWKVGNSGTTGWKLSSDMYSITPQTPGGHSIHSDWIMGWNPEIMQRVLDHCNNIEADCVVDNLGDGGGLSTQHQNPMYR